MLLIQKQLPKHLFYEYREWLSMKVVVNVVLVVVVVVVKGIVVEVLMLNLFN
jgi:hypothetical protein